MSQERYTHEASEVSAESREAGGAAARQAYKAPRVLVVGKAVDLVQGYLWGAYSDGYTGYYWDR